MVAASFVAGCASSSAGVYFAITVGLVIIGESSGCVELIGWSLFVLILEAIDYFLVSLFALFMRGFIWLFWCLICTNAICGLSFQVNQRICDEVSGQGTIKCRLTKLTRKGER